MESYSIWLLEYGYCSVQPVSSLIYSKHNQGIRQIPFTFLVMKGNGHTIAVDTGYYDTGYAHELSLRFAMTRMQPIEDMLAAIGIAGGEFDAVLLTHAHYDHLGGAKAFPNAHFYIQKKELFDWIEIMAKPQAYSFLTAAIDPGDIQYAVGLIGEQRMTLLDGQVDDLLPGISLVPVFDTHSYGHQLVTVRRGINDDSRWIFTGDACYSFENFGADPAIGPYLPVGFGVGSLTNMVAALDLIHNLAEGDLRRLIIPHDDDMWRNFPSSVTREGMHIAEIQLAPGETSRL